MGKWNGVNVCESEDVAFLSTDVFLWRCVVGRGLPTAFSQSNLSKIATAPIDSKLQ